ncbi:acyl-CoA Delta-9 desaturase-like [Halictus rubicundus]|uniref:acyl-CoA Delta-9 desaturase-like n=1 Tax=Halictus rubicundus TaxID=77578 RepID=UPI0040375DB8
MDTETNHNNENSPHEINDVLESEQYGTDMSYKHKYLWPPVVAQVLMQMGWLIGIYTALFHAQTATILWGVFVGFFAIQGVGLGAHRYLTHRSFKATPLLRLILIICHTMSGQNSMFTWARDHIMHHKYSDTDLDPHNSNRGLFFSHMGWLMMQKHPLLRQKEREMDWSELTQDKLIMFQHNYFLYLYVPLAVIFPVSVPIYFWNESLWNSFFVAYCLQYVTNLHTTWSINSAAHAWGSKPYDKRIRPAESPIVIALTLGDGWHNFHHAFPWDYRMTDRSFSVSARVLEFLAYLGLAYDLKMVTPNIVQGHSKRHGNAADRETFVNPIGNIAGKQKG